MVGHTHCLAAVQCHGWVSTGKIPDNVIARFSADLIQTTKSLDLAGKSTPDAVQEIVEANIKKQVKNVAASPAIQAAWKDNKEVFVHGWVYELETGTLRDLNVTIGPNNH